VTCVRTLGLLAIAASALAALVIGEIVLARGRDYLVDVPFAIDRTVDVADGDRDPVELRVLGDSTAAGVGTGSPEEALPVLVAARVARRLDRPVHVVGLGVSGARTADVTRQQLAMVRDADVVVIAVGSNDVIHVTAPWRFREQTATLLGEASALDAVVVLGGIPRFSGVDALLQPLRALVDGYAVVLRDDQRAVAARHPDVRFVDIAALASPRFVGVPEAMSRDRFHPSAVGYGFWADALAPAVVDALGD
jgi:lysophospholipase L1-like esterase